MKYSIVKEKLTLPDLFLLALESKDERIIHDLLHYSFFDPNALESANNDTFLQVAL